MLMFALKQLIASGLGAAVNLDQHIHMQRNRYVLSYHRILPAQLAEKEGIHHALWVTPDRLASQIRWMRSVGDIVDYSRLVDTSLFSERPMFALTFDDGWKDNVEYALPILKQYEVPALVFLATDAVDSGALFWPQDIATKTQRLLINGGKEKVIASLCECWPEEEGSFNVKPTKTLEMVESWIETLKLMSENERCQRIGDYYRCLQLSTNPLTGYIMSWDEAREMQKHGINFGSHSHHHAILEGLQPEQIEHELRQSRALIADNLQVEVDSFCYPNGRYSGKEGIILSRCGYRYGFRLDNMSMRHCTDNLYIPRFLVSERNSANPSYFKLYLLETPLYQTKPHYSHRIKP